jgi:hypothetical protein
MASARQVLEVVVTGNTRGAIAAFDQLEQKADRTLGAASSGMDKFASSSVKAGAIAVGFAAVSGAALLSVGQAAATLETTVKATGAIFKDASKPVDEFARNSAKLAGLSETEARQATTRIGSLLTSYGFTVDEAAAKSVQLTKLGADLALRFGRPVEEAVSAVAATLRGERDPIEQFGVALKETDVNAKIMALGLDTGTAAAQSHAKAVASLALIEERTASSVGAFGDAQDTAAGKLAVFRAETENLKANIGQGVLPILSRLAQGANGIIGGFNGMSESSQQAVGSVATIGTVAAGTFGATALLAGGLVKATTAFRGLSGSAKTFAGVAGGVGAAVAGIAAVFAASETLGRDLKVNLEAGTQAANDFAKSDIFGGELSRLLGEDASKLGEIIRTIQELQTGGIGGNVDKFGSTIGDMFSDSAGITEINRAKDTIAAVDQILAGLVSGGDMSTAAALWKQLAGAADEQGISVNALNALLPGYIASIEQAGSSNQAAASQIDGFASAIERTSDAVEGQRARIDAAQGFERVASAVQRVADLQREQAAAGQADSDAARRVADAHERVADALRSHSDAVKRLQDAQEDLADFNSAEEANIRGLEREQILRRRITTAEEARQKEIDLYRFDQRTAQEQERLNEGVSQAERAVEDSTRRVADAHQDVADAAEERAAREKDYAAEIRKAQLDVDAAALGVLETYIKSANELGTNSAAAKALREQLEGIATLIGPDTPLGQLILGTTNVGQLTPAQAQALSGQFGTPVSQSDIDSTRRTFGDAAADHQRWIAIENGTWTGPISPQDVAKMKEWGVPGFANGGIVPGPIGVPRLAVVHGGEEISPRPRGHMSIVQNNTFVGGEVPTTTQLDAQNRKLGIRVALAGRR